MKLLIVEDERELSDSMVAYLSSENYVCEQAFTYSEARTKVALYDYDCVLLDLMLPGGNGLDILRDIRRRQNPTGVIIISAKGRSTTRWPAWKSGRTIIWQSRSTWPSSRCAFMPSSGAGSFRPAIYCAAMALRLTCQPSRSV